MITNIQVVKIDLLLLLVLIFAPAVVSLMLVWWWKHKQSSSRIASTSSHGQGELFSLLSRYDHNLDTYLATLRVCMTALKRTGDQGRLQIEGWDPLWREAFTSLSSMAHFVQQMRLIRYGYQPNGQTKSFVPLHTTLNAILGSWLEAAEEKRIEIKHDIDKRVQVEGTAEALTEIFNTLVENVIKHSGGTELVMELIPEKQICLVRVSDNGRLGIAPEVQERIFEEGSRDRTAGSSTGSGMGLATAKILTEQMGGTIALRTSVPGKTVFEVSLPRASTPDQSATASP